MVYTPQKPKNGFIEAYSNLSQNDRRRLKISICTICEISKKTFYEWLQNPEKISKGNRFHIANLFGMDSNTLFNPKN